MSLKSFLDWFGKDESPGESAGPQDWREKRNSNRVDLDPERSLGVNLQIPTGGDKASVVHANVKNVSMRGCRLEMATVADREKLYVAQVALASLDVDSFSIPLQLEVLRFVGEREVAVRFKPPFPRELEKLERFLEPRCLGRSLREIDPAALQKTAADGKNLRWFQGVNETNLFSWLDAAGEVTHQQLVFTERVVEWRAGAKARTGRVRSEGRSSGPGWVPAELLEFDEKADSALLAQARTLLESSRIDSNMKDAFLRHLK
jgi:hypothetical protein